MIRKKIKHISAIMALSSTLLFTHSAASEQDFAAGVAVGAMMGAVLHHMTPVL